MNARFLLLILSVATISSCSTVYKSGQTPDDVYYSPAKERPAYVTTKEEEEKYNYDDEYANLDDRYIRMKRYNRGRWSAFDDDYLYWNDYRWNSQPYYNRWNSYTNWGWSSWYGSQPWLNPFCPVYYGTPIVIVNPKPVYRNPVANGPRTFNLNTFTTPTTGSTNSKYGTRSYKYYNGNSNNRTYSPSDSRGSSPARTFDRSNNSSSSGNSGSKSSGSSGSSGGSAPVRSFPKKGG
jgi:hypothetical protein